MYCLLPLCWMVGFELDASEIVVVRERGAFSPLTHHGSELHECAGEKWSELRGDQIRACVEMNVVQLRHLPASVQTARGGRTFPAVSSCASLEMQVVGGSRRPDFNKDSLLFSSALKCKLFHRALLLSNTAECKMNTAIRCHTNSLCFLEHHNLLASCGSGSTRAAFHLNSLS